MKKVLVALLICSTAMATPYFGAYQDDVHKALHPSRNNIEAVLKNISSRLAGSPKWIGTNAEAHKLVRRSVINSLNINVPVGQDLDTEPTQVDFRATNMRMRLLNQGYSEEEVDLFVLEFRNLTHPPE